MPALRLSMRKIIDVLRLSATTTLSTRQIATAVGLGETSVRDYRRRAAKAGLGWPLPLMLGDEPLDDAALERLLFPPPPPAAVERATLDFEHIHRELRRKGVTLNLLWQEYRHQHPDGYRYTRFCELYATWRDDLDIVMALVDDALDRAPNHVRPVEGGYDRAHSHG